jgi:hypothetical protein
MWVAGQKQWNETQSDQLLAIEREMRKIVFHLNGLTSALSDRPEDERRGCKAAAEAASTVHTEINRLTKIVEFAEGGTRPDNGAKQATGSEIKIRLKEPERLALNQTARARDTTAAQLGPISNRRSLVRQTAMVRERTQRTAHHQRPPCAG